MSIHARSLGDLQDAIDSYLAAYAIDKDDECERQTGVGWGKSCDHKQARSCQKILAFNNGEYYIFSRTGMGLVLANLAQAYQDSGNRDKALEWFAR